MQAIHRASTDSAGAVQTGVQGDLSWTQHGGGARAWWPVSFCGGGLYEGDTAVVNIVKTTYVDN